MFSLNRWIRQTFGKSRSRPVTKLAAPRQPRRGLRFEELEERATPSTLLHSLFPDPAGPVPGSLFGRSVAADGTYLVVGVPNTPVGGFPDAGSAYVYSATTGALVVTINNPNPGLGDLFGYSVGISGNRVVVVGLDDLWDCVDAATATGEGAKTLNLSPHGAIVSALLQQRGPGVLNPLASSKRGRLFVPIEIELPQLSKVVTERIVRPPLQV